MRFSRLIWLGTVLSFLRNNQETLLPYHGSSRRNDMTQRLKIVRSFLMKEKKQFFSDVGVYIRALRYITLFESERRERRVGVTILDIMS